MMCETSHSEGESSRAGERLSFWRSQSGFFRADAARSFPGHGTGSIRDLSTGRPPDGRHGGEWSPYRSPHIQTFAVAIQLGRPRNRSLCFANVRLAHGALFRAEALCLGPGIAVVAQNCRQLHCSISQLCSIHACGAGATSIRGWACRRRRDAFSAKESAAQGHIESCCIVPMCGHGHACRPVLYAPGFPICRHATVGVPLKRGVPLWKARMESAGNRRCIFHERRCSRALTSRANG